MATERAARLRARKEIRKDTNRFFNSISDLRRAHRKLFDPSIHAAINRRYVGGSGYGLMTCSVRCPAREGESARLRPVLGRALAYLIDQFDSDSPYQVIAFLSSFCFCFSARHFSFFSR